MLCSQCQDNVRDNKNYTIFGNFWKVNGKYQFIMAQTFILSSVKINDLVSMFSVQFLATGRSTNNKLPFL